MTADGPSIGRPGADCGRHRLFDDLDATRTGKFGRILDRAFLDARDLGRHADNHAWLRFDDGGPPRAVFHHFLDEVRKHRFGHFEIGNNAVTQWTNRLNVRRRFAEHLTGLLTDGEDFPGVHVFCDDGRLAQNDALALDMHEHVGRAKIDADIQTSNSRNLLVRGGEDDHPAAVLTRGYSRVSKIPAGSTSGVMPLLRCTWPPSAESNSSNRS
jgi:hypothetical protein